MSTQNTINSSVSNRRVVRCGGRRSSGSYGRTTNPNHSGGYRGKEAANRAVRRVCRVILRDAGYEGEI